jgi:hypothetical protein
MKVVTQEYLRARLTCIRVEGKGDVVPGHALKGKRELITLDQQNT